MADRVELPIHFDSTMRSCFVSCPEKYNLEFVYGYRPRGLSIDLHAGACFATGLESTYRGIWERDESYERAIERAHFDFMNAWGDVEVPPYKRTAKTKDRTWESIVGDGTDKGQGYFQKYPPRSDHVQPFFTADGKPTFEYTFAIPLEPMVTFDPLLTNMEDREEIQRTHFPAHPSGAPFIYCGRFDLLGAYMGRPCVRDEKTTGSSIGDAWADQWNMRGQFLGYVWACQQGGMDLDTVVIRGIAIQKTQFSHAEAIRQYSKFLVTKWHEQLRRDLWRLRRQYDEGVFDMSFGEACSAYGGCTFRDACTSPNKESWLSNFEVRHWNPLLKNPIGTSP